MWVFISIIVTALTVWLLYWLSGKFKMAWYQMLLAVLGVASLLVAIQNYIGFKAEFQPTAANQSLVIFGLLGFIRQFGEPFIRLFDW